MAGQYLTKWTELKTNFESDAGNKIAAIEKKEQAGKKASELREKDGKVRLKKPAEKNFWGRKDSGMETACKALDSATAAKVDEKTRTKALSTYRAAEGKYIEVLLNAAKQKPYSLVTNEIAELQLGMEWIAADFTKHYTQRRSVHKGDDDATNVKTVELFIKELEASEKFLVTVSIKNAEGALTSRINAIVAHLKKLNSDTVSQLQSFYVERHWWNQHEHSKDTAVKLNKAILKLLKRIVIEQTVAGSEVGKEEIKSKKVDADGLLDIVRKTIQPAIIEARAFRKWLIG
jgi:hypothetical protein